jgi:hypothetical protein
MKAHLAQGDAIDVNLRRRVGPRPQLALRPSEWEAMRSNGSSDTFAELQPTPVSSMSAKTAPRTICPGGAAEMAVEHPDQLHRRGSDVRRKGGDVGSLRGR